MRWGNTSFWPPFTPRSTTPPTPASSTTSSSTRKTRRNSTSYVENVKALAEYDTGVSAEFGDTLLTLSTCSDHVENGRFVVVAKRVR